MKSVKSVVLAVGEATGHAHRASGHNVQLIDDVLLAPDGVEVEHEEHNDFSLSPGSYKRGIVQEFNHFSKEAQKVVD
jgi:hypothetical protein